MHKIIYLLLTLLLPMYPRAQELPPEEEMQMLRLTLSQYLDGNPNSLSCFLRDHECYNSIITLLEFFQKIDTDNLPKTEMYEATEDYKHLADSSSIVLQQHKISVQIPDTLYAYNYIPSFRNLKTKADWDDKYLRLLEDFKYNKMARLKAPVGEEYIELIKKQIEHPPQSIQFARNLLDYSYYQYVPLDSHPCEPGLCIVNCKVYRPVYNSSLDKACYLFSHGCRDSAVCRSFVFASKESGEWTYLDDYPSWLVDDNDSE